MAPKGMSIEAARELLTKTKTVTLPVSKIDMEIKHLTVYDYIKEGFGEMPNDFFQFVLTSLGQDTKKKMTDEQLKKHYSLAERFLKFSLQNGCLKPKVMLVYDKEKIKTHLLYTEIPKGDQAFLLNEIIGK